MTSLLFGIIVAALLSVTSLLVVLFRVSPLTAPAQALPAFFLSVLLSTTTVGTLLAYTIWRSMRIHLWDEGKTLSISLREGMFFGAATVILVLFQILGMLNWWVALCIYGIFVFVELALHS